MDSICEWDGYGSVNTIEVLGDGTVMAHIGVRNGKEPGDDGFDDDYAVSDRIFSYHRAVPASARIEATLRAAHSSGAYIAYSMASDASHQNQPDDPSLHTLTMAVIDYLAPPRQVPFSVIPTPPTG
jgi:hypothetical protein